MNLNEVPLESLKKELADRGYTVLKSKVLPKYEKCTCGGVMHRTWHCQGKVALECIKCSKRTPYCDNEYDARVYWNNMILKEQDNK